MKYYQKILKKLEAIKRMKDLQVLSKQRGAIFALTALLLPVIFGFLGLGYDVGNLYVHKEVLKNAVHLNGKSVGLYTDENENAADQTTDYGCGDKVFLEEFDFAFDEAAEKEYQYSETYGLDDVELDDHGNCLL